MNINSDIYGLQKQADSATIRQSNNNDNDNKRGAMEKRSDIIRSEFIASRATDLALDDSIKNLAIPPGALKVDLAMKQEETGLLANANLIPAAVRLWNFLFITDAGTADYQGGRELEKTVIPSKDVEVFFVNGDSPINYVSQFYYTHIHIGDITFDIINDDSYELIKFVPY